VAAGAVPVPQPQDDMSRKLIASSIICLP
jgi:hypothetical protein